MTRKVTSWQLAHRKPPLTENNSTRRLSASETDRNPSADVKALLLVLSLEKRHCHLILHPSELRKARREGPRFIIRILSVTGDDHMPNLTSQPANIECKREQGG